MILPKIAFLSSALISCFSIQLIFSFNNNKNEPSDKPTHDVDKAFYRHYLEMLLTLNRIHALTPWQMSMLLWRAKIFHIQVLYPELLRISLCTEQEKDEIRFMKGWKLKELEKIMPAWQRRQCEEIKRERWRGF